MSSTTMDPYYEHRLREEVIYLHSLWHQGPPRRNPNHNRNTSTTHLPPSNPPQFKKQKPIDNKPRGRRGKEGKKNPPHFDPPPISDVEWPCEKTPVDPSPSGWPVPSPAIRVPSAEEQAQFAATLVQKKAITDVEAFFAGKLDSDGEEIDSSDEDDLMDGDGYEEYQFFLKMFTGNGELRGYYEKNWEGGDFVCLVCSGIGKRRRFKHCVALVRHSITIEKTKKKKAHRAYAQVLCRVLGWDIDRLPDIVLPKPLESQGNAEVAIGGSSMINKKSGLENFSNGEVIPKEVTDVDQEEELASSSVPAGTSNVIGDNVMLCQNSLKDGDANKSLENPDNGV